MTMTKTAGGVTALPVRIEHGPTRLFGLESERAEVFAGLLRELPRIDSKYFYDDTGSHLFEEITGLPEYYQTRTEEALLETIAEEVVQTTGARELVELGSGAGRKIRILLDEMRRTGRLERCVLLDINESFLRASAEALAAGYDGLEVRGVIGDFLHDLEIAGDGEHRRLFLFFAGTIGNLYPRQLGRFLRRVGAVSKPGDAFLVGLDLIKDRERLEAAYNDSAGVTAEFNLNALRVLNQRFATDFEIDAFEHVAFYDAENEWIEMRLRASRRTSVSLGDADSLQFEAGDDIRTEISRKFSRESFTAVLEGSGLELWRWYTDPEELFATALVRPVRDGESS
jgi:L-histidine N-alpha-methyltransferase